jgi:hypothetical protein
MTEFAFNPDTLTVPAGRDTFTLDNAGQFPHNMHIEGNGISVDVKPDGPVPGGGNFTGAVSLTPGTYEVWCPVNNHRERGMVGTLTVAGQATGGAAGGAATGGAAGGGTQLPRALPRTGDADPGLPIAQAGVVGGLLLLGAGLFARRRSTSTR